ncbi:MAG: LacI family transcriptional regulator [Bacteroidia bacterium]|nr:MAG: LacI family transcriptional regulator [Bacteroidia bacterium]
MGKKIRIKDIAARLGLSSTLVSLVINNKADQHGIKRETQEKVMLLAHKMGYFLTKPEENSVQPVQESPGLIGMIVPSMSDPFIIELVPYMQKALGSIGIGLSVMTRDPLDRRFARFIPGFKKFFSGLILTGDTADDVTIRALRANDYPFIIIESNPQNMRLNLVRSDCKAGVELMIHHIQKLGYINITLVSRENPVSLVYESLDFFKNFISELIPGSILNEALVARIPGVNNIDTEMLSEYLRPPYKTQLFVVSEASLVYPVMEYLVDNNIRVPHDVALVSLEDGIGFDLFYTPVTRIRRQIPELASKASKMIWTEIKNSGHSKFKRTVIITPELVIAKSCGSII